ncbi:hypothetical protein HK098_007029 [Nowakowskiella sp. JEL0407]|nr:hypothetical protein HK098_007029 [Nowakowskiella sp. JEL0407]
MALVVHFYNLLNANKQAQTTHYIPVVSTPQRNHHGISTLIGNVSNAIQDISRRDSEEVELVKREEIGISSEEAADWTRFYLPLVGAIVHAFGNTPTTMFGKSAFWFDLFLFSYGVSYPFYTYFLYLNVIAEKSNLPNGTIVWPEYTKKDHIKIFVGCLVVVLVVMGTALLNA